MCFWHGGSPFTLSYTRAVTASKANAKTTATANIPATTKPRKAVISIARVGSVAMIRTSATTCWHLWNSRPSLLAAHGCALR
jgi:hypothetical protein